MDLMFRDWLMKEATKVTIYTQSSSKGATVNDGEADEQPVMLDLDDIVNYEQAGKMLQPRSQENMAKILDAIKNGEQLPPILVRRTENLRGVSKPRWDGRNKVSSGGVSNSRYKYQIVDGHHRYWAYKKAGVKRVPAIIVSPENIRYEKFWKPD